MDAAGAGQSCPASEALSSGYLRTDELDRRIIECTIQNPRITVEGIVRRLEEQKIKFSESTIQKRLADLLNQKRLEWLIVLRDWVASGYRFRYRVDVKVDMRELRLGRGGPPEDSSSIDSQKKLCAYIKDELGRQYQSRLVILDVTVLLGVPG